MKRFLGLLLCITIIFSSYMCVSAAVEITDVFGDDYIQYDANFDGYFDLRDFVRVKKYYADMPVTINLNFTDSSPAQTLANIGKELLGM